MRSPRVIFCYLSVLLIFFLIASGAAQVNPALTGRKAPKPTVPKIDEKACPFEGCQFGKWTAQESVELFSTWKPGRAAVGKVAKGEEVSALTGVHITYEPEEIEITAPIAQYGLKTGDKVFGYMNLGEGFMNAWFNGTWVEEFDASGIRRGEEGCMRDCSGKQVKPGRYEWWVQMRTKDGAIGWTQEPDKFDGKDSLAKAQRDVARYRGPSLRSGGQDRRRSSAVRRPQKAGRPTTDSQRLNATTNKGYNSA